MELYSNTASGTVVRTIAVDPIGFFSGDPNGIVTGLLGAIIINSLTGEVYKNSDAGTTWPLVLGAGVGSIFVIVNYTVLGTEPVVAGSTDFMVSIGVTMANENYRVVVGAFAPFVTDSSSEPTIAVPNNLAGDRTITQFRVQMTTAEVGQILTFIVFAA